jgi:hypothetical protein
VSGSAAPYVLPASLHAHCARRESPLIYRLDRDEAHGWLTCHNGDSLGIGCVVLAAEPERLDEFGCDETSSVTACYKPAAPVMR